MKVEISQLEGWQLDYATGLALGYKMLYSDGGTGPAYRDDRTDRAYQPAESPDDLYAVLLRMSSILHRHVEGSPPVWFARAEGVGISFASGSSIGIAVCRALVWRVLGVVVDLPDLPIDDCGDLF